jgi:IS5 family transposase
MKRAINALFMPTVLIDPKPKNSVAETDIASQICEKGTRGKPLTEEQKHANRTKSKVRARVEHVFGAQAAMGGHRVRTIGLERAKVKIGLMNLVCNMKRLVQRIQRDMKITAPLQGGVPEMA